MLDWKEDGKDHWLAHVGQGRDAHITKEQVDDSAKGRRDVYRARWSGGGTDAGGQQVGSYDTIEEARRAFAPDGNHRGALDDKALAARASADKPPRPRDHDPVGGLLNPGGQSLHNPTAAGTSAPAAHHDGEGRPIVDPLLNTPRYDPVTGAPLST